MARESRRPLDLSALPDQTAVCVITLAELQAGVLHRATVNDLWIAAVALASDMHVATQDDEFDVIEMAGGPAVIRI